MTRTTFAWSIWLGVAVIAAGCDSGPGPQGPTQIQPQKPAVADPNKPDDPPQQPSSGGPPGLAPGVVQIFRTVPGQQEQAIGCLVSGPVGEFWILPKDVPYPVDCELGHSLRFEWVNPALADADSNQIVTWQELLASPLATNVPGKKSVRRINEVVTPIFTEP